MSRALTVELSEKAYSALERRAQVKAQSPAIVAAEALEQRFGLPEETHGGEAPVSEAELQALRQRFERHIGAVDLGHATGADNDGIDADLARAYADNGKGS
jgi:predicted transcriptional regulator